MGKEKPEGELLFLYRYYAHLLVEWKRACCGSQGDSTARVKVKTWRWQQMCKVRTSSGLEWNVPADEVGQQDTVVGKAREPESVGAWRALRFLSFGGAEGGNERVRQLAAFCARRPKGKMPQTVTVAQSEYEHALLTAVDLNCDLIVENSGDLPLPWGEGNSRAPKTQGEFEHLCGVLRDRDPDTERGVAAILDSADLPEPLGSAAKVEPFVFEWAFDRKTERLRIRIHNTTFEAKDARKDSLRWRWISALLRKPGETVDYKVLQGMKLSPREAELRREVRHQQRDRARNPSEYDDELGKETIRAEYDKESFSPGPAGVSRIRPVLLRAKKKLCEYFKSTGDEASADVIEHALQLQSTWAIFTPPTSVQVRESTGLFSSHASSTEQP